MFWPESSHKPLLQATILSGPKALAAWEEWKAQVNWDDDPDSGSYRLLSHLFNNLNELQVDDPLMMKLRGIARKNWVNNQRTLFSAPWPWSDFHKHGIDFIILPGASTALQYYPEYVLIPATRNCCTDPSP